MASGMRRRSVGGGVLLVQALVGLGAARTARAQEPAAAVVVSPEVQRATEVEAGQCAGGDDSALLASLLGGEQIDSVEPLYGAPAAEGGGDRLIGATLKIKPGPAQPAVNAAAVRRALECDAARRTLGRPGVLAAPNDPFWLAGHELAFDVGAAHEGYRIIVRAHDPAGAQQVLATANALIEATHPAPAAPETNAPKAAEPFAFGDFTWLNGNSRQKDYPLDTPVVTGEFMTDSNYTYSFNHPKDHTIDGSTTSGRSNEFQVMDVGIGGDFHWKNMRGRFMTQFGMYSTMTPRNDSSPSRGQWDLADAYRYISEAYGGYHIDKLNGINVDAGIFVSYIGLCSYYNYENWVYQPSYVSANTPFFFNGMRVQIFTSDKLKIEPWLINGWQSYGEFNEQPGAGLQVLYKPTESLSIHSNSYFGADVLEKPGRFRFHTDNSVQVKYYQNKKGFLDRGAFSFTADAGCEQGAGVTCGGGSGGPAQTFLGFMVYNRLNFLDDLFGLTIGGGAITNPGRYLVLLPPINGATATSGTPYFTENPGDAFMAWDASITLDWMPSQFVTFRWEGNHRQSSVGYFAGPGGMTPEGGNTGPAGSEVQGFTPDLRKYENRMQFALMTRL